MTNLVSSRQDGVKVVIDCLGGHGYMLNDDNNLTLDPAFSTLSLFALNEEVAEIVNREFEDWMEDGSVEVDIIVLESGETSVLDRSTDTMISWGYENETPSEEVI